MGMNRETAIAFIVARTVDLSYTQPEATTEDFRPGSRGVRFGVKISYNGIPSEIVVHDHGDLRSWQDYVPSQYCSSQGDEFGPRLGWSPYSPLRLDVGRLETFSNELVIRMARNIMRVWPPRVGEQQG